MAPPIFLCPPESGMQIFFLLRSNQNTGDRITFHDKASAFRREIEQQNVFAYTKHSQIAIIITLREEKSE